MKKTITFYLFAVLAVSALLLSTVNAQIISEEARRHMARGQAAVEIAKSPDEYDAAIKEFQQASRLAPDWRDPYYQLATLQEKTGKLKEAVASLKEYLRLAPNAPDAAKIQEQIYKLEYKAEQTITDEVALDIFGSLGNESMWQCKCSNSNCNCNWYQGKFHGRDGRQIIVTNNESNETRQRLTPNGTTLIFDTIEYVCGRSTQENRCPRFRHFSLEIVSRSHVKMVVKMAFPSLNQVENIDLEFVKK